MTMKMFNFIVKTVSGSLSRTRSHLLISMTLFGCTYIDTHTRSSSLDVMWWQQFVDEHKYSTLIALIIRNFRKYMTIFSYWNLNYRHAAWCDMLLKMWIFLIWPNWDIAEYFQCHKINFKEICRPIFVWINWQHLFEFDLLLNNYAFLLTWW